MKSYSFIDDTKTIFESKRHLMRILSRYDKEGQAKIRDKMLALGKANGGWYNPVDYAKMFKSGQQKRAIDLRNRYHRYLFAGQVPFINNAQTITGKTSDIIAIPTNNAILHPQIKSKFIRNVDIPQLTGRSSNIKTKYRRQLQNKTIPELDSAFATGHEIDEYSTILKLAKRHHTTPDKITDELYGKKRPSKISTVHSNKDIIDKEHERARLFSALFGRNSFFHPPRSNEEYSNLWRLRSPNLRPN